METATGGDRIRVVVPVRIPSRASEVVTLMVTVLVVVVMVTVFVVAVLVTLIVVVVMVIVFVVVVMVTVFVVFGNVVDDVLVLIVIV